MPKSPERPIRYPMVSVAVCGSSHRTGVSEALAAKIEDALAKVVPGLIAYAPPLTHIDAMVLMGWETETAEVKFRDDEVLLTDRYGVRVRCTNNVRNRPIYPSQYEGYVQDILNQKWELNGENVIIGRDGIVLNGQHTLIALVLAQQDRDRLVDAETGTYRWSDQWPDGVVKMEKTICYGIENSDRVVNTMDTCKPRSLSDVLYRTPYFARLPKKSPDGIDRVTAARTCDAAVKSMWLRTGCQLEYLNPRMTHSEAVRFVDTHKRILRCVSHVIEYGPAIRKYVGLGYASAAMYLMGSAASDEEKYYALDERTEKGLDWSCYELAERFWSTFNVEGGSLQALTEAFDDLQTRYGEDTPRFAERDRLVCVAWQKYVTAEPVTKSDFHLSKMYSPPDPATGIRALKGNVNLGGIDLGTSKLHRNPEEGLEPAPAVKEEVENVKEKVNGEHKLLPLNDTGDVLPSVEEARRKLHVENPDCGPILMRNALKKWVLYEADAQVFSKHINRLPELNPAKLLNVRFTEGEAESAADVWTDAGHTVGWATETNGVWVVDRIDRPKKVKGGTK